MKESSVYVLPSYREGIPRTVLEAMAVGRPIITTFAPGCKETVSQGENGYLIPIKDAKELEQKMNNFIFNKQLIKTMGVKSREKVVREFNVHNVNKVFIKEMSL